MRSWLKEMIESKIEECICIEAAIDGYIENVLSDIDVTDMIARHLDETEIVEMVENAIDEYIND